MKKVEAIIKPYQLEDVRDALHEHGFQAMTVSESRRFRDLRRRTVDLGFGEAFAFQLDFDPTLKVELVIPDGREDAAIRAIEAISPSSPITVQRVQDVIRIRTNEHGEVAV
jgi:nitrogen regulatory protein P-II 1